MALVQGQHSPESLSEEMHHIAFLQERVNVSFDLIPKYSGRAPTTFKCVFASTGSSYIQAKHLPGIAAWHPPSLGCLYLRQLSVADKAVGSTSTLGLPQDI